MIRTKDPFKDVPSTWVFEYYCKLQEKLYGQDIKIKSLFNSSDTDPSMVIYCKDGVYRFNDFSSGHKGSTVDLVSHLYGLKPTDAKKKILSDYTNRSTGDVEVIIQNLPKYEITSCIKRKWNELDAKFWTQFGIGSRLLEKYNVAPISSYTMSKGTESFVVERQHVYGYFKGNGDLYKMYRPKADKFKFMTMNPHIQGSDQLSYHASILVICSSLKDLMSLDALDLNVEGVAPSSENTMLPKSVLSAYALKYSKIYTLFDNDEAGHKAMDKYKDTYGIPGIYLNLSKDLSDSVRDFGLDKTRKFLKPLLL